MQDMESWARQGAACGATIVAREQTHGIGRRGRAWASPNALGLYMTLLLRPPPQRQLASLSILGGLAVWRCVQAMGATSTGLKWPNDVWAEGRKLGGVLLQAHQDGNDTFVCVGIGLNLAPAKMLCLPPEVAPKPVGLADLLPVDWEARAEAFRHSVAHGVAHALQEAYAIWRTTFDLTGLRDDLARADLLRGARVRAQMPEGPVVGMAEGIDVQGALCLRLPDGLRRITTGEVTQVRLE